MLLVRTWALLTINSQSTCPDIAFSVLSLSSRNTGKLRTPFMNKKSIHSKNLELQYCVNLLSITYSILVQYICILPGIATTMHELRANPEAVKADPEKLKILFNEMIQMCLWYVWLVLTQHSNYVWLTGSTPDFRGNATVNAPTMARKAQILTSLSRICLFSLTSRKPIFKIFNLLERMRKLRDNNLSWRMTKSQYGTIFKPWKMDELILCWIIVCSGSSLNKLCVNLTVLPAGFEVNLDSWCLFWTSKICSYLPTWSSPISSWHTLHTFPKSFSSRWLLRSRGSSLTYGTHLSPKLIPWFVSDVTPPDFRDAFSVLVDPSFFPEDVTTVAESGFVNLKEMVSRWTLYLERGVFSLSVPVDTPLGGSEASKDANFWTSSKPYWNMETEAPGAFKTLRKSGLVIFKVCVIF